MYNKVKRTLERVKSKKYPAVPSSIQDLQIEFKKPHIIEKYGYTFDGDAKLYIDTVVTPHHEFTVFASHFVIDFIQNNMAPETRNYLMDGTFDSLPAGFYQMLIISVEYQNDVSGIF